jgi:hypothetical protein
VCILAEIWQNIIYFACERMDRSFIIFQSFCTIAGMPTNGNNGIILKCTCKIQIGEENWQESAPVVYWKIVLNWSLELHFYYIVIRGLKTGIIEQIKTAIAGQWLSRHAPTTVCIHTATEDPLAMFCMQSGLRVYSKDTLESQVSPCVEMGSNTTTVALRIIGGDKKGT